MVYNDDSSSRRSAGTHFPVPGGRPVQEAEGGRQVRTAHSHTKEYQDNLRRKGGMSSS